MMKNLLYRALASVRAYAAYFVIGGVGLALSLACFILLVSYVHRERATDSVFSKLGRIYAMCSHYPDERPFIEDMSVIFHGIDPRDVPGVEDFTRVNYTPDSELRRGEQRYDADVIITDSSFLKVFDFPLEAGSSQALKAPRSAVLSRAMAETIFPEGDPLGRTVEWSGVECTVTGIMAPLRGNTSVAADAIMNLEGLEWRVWQGSAGFLTLSPSASFDDAQRELAARIEPLDEDMTFSLDPLERLYADTTVDRELYAARSGNPLTQNVLLVVALAMFAVGLFNYFNLVSVVSMCRGRELGTMRILGASRGKLYMQLYAENLYAVAAATGAALLVVEYARPLVSGQFGIDFKYVWSFDGPLLALLVIGIPALMALPPCIRYGRAVTGTAALRDSVRRSGVRTALVGLQYAVTVVLIVMSVWFVRQLRAMLAADPGYRTENIVMLSGFERRGWKPEGFDDEAYMESGRKHFRHAALLLDGAPYVEGWAFGQSLTEECTGTWKVGFRRAGTEKFIPVTVVTLSGRMQDIYGIRVRSGRKIGPGDGFTSNKLLVTASAARLFGVGEGEPAVLECAYTMWSTGDGSSDNRYEVIGIAEDIRPGSVAHEAGPPVVFIADSPEDEDGNMYGGIGLVVRHAPGKLDETLALLKKITDETTGTTLSCKTEREQVEALYAEDKRIASVYTVFAGMAVVVSALGLFGLTLFNVRRRRREIALRRINGASRRQITVFLMRRYAAVIAVAFCTACPVAWWAVERYAQGFALRAPLSWWMFAAAGLTVAAVSLATVGFLALRAASANPSDAIKTE